MAKKPVKETSTALIFATVFFVLTTIAFGVMWYMEFAERDANKAAVDAAKKSEVAATGAMNDEKFNDLVDRLYIDMATDDEKKIVTEWADKDKKRAADRIMNKLEKSIIEKIGKGDKSKLPPELKLWTATEAGPGDLPNESPFQIIGNLVKDREAAQVKEKEATALFEKAVKDMKNSQSNADATIKKFEELAVTLPMEFKTKLDAEIAKYELRKTDFTKNEAASRKELDKLSDDLGQKTRDITKRDNQILALLDQVKDMVGKITKTQQQETFINDEPQGKVLRRLIDGVIEINLGSDARVLPGLTFTILPNDFPEKGRQSRVRLMRVQDERGNYKNVERFVEKATIEVIEVIGPKLSRCRITQEYDSIRDGAAPGDLLYNSVWRKGSADHIALIGMFDINGDGSDDIETVIRDLTRMGIPVDAYFDMKQRKWVGQITEQTRFVVEGWYPIQGVMDPNRDDKTKLLSDMGAAIDFARKKGVATVNFRDFFPRMGYKVKLDLHKDKINQATAPYLNKVTAPEAPKDPN